MRSSVFLNMMRRFIYPRRAVPGFCALSSNAPAREVPDFLGAPIRVSTASTRLLIDNSILHIVTRNDDATPILTEAVAKDPGAGMAWALLGFEYYRNTTTNLKAKHILACLDSLDRLSRDGKLADREANFGAALLAFVEGRYTTAAVILDAVVEDYGYDLIAMRLAQDCYMRAGDGPSALSCVAKRMNLYHDTHDMHGHVLGMLATGYIECGLYIEAEECGQQAVIVSKGSDTNAVQAVLSAVHLSYKSMNLSREVLDYAGNSTGPGRHPFSFLEGNFQLHQGNFNGALETFDLLLERISDMGTRFLSSLVYATMLLILIDLQVQHLAVDARWERLGGFWDTMPLGKGSIYATPLSEFCSATTYSRIIKRRIARGDRPLPPAVSTEKMTGIFSYFAPQKVNLEHEQSLAVEKWDRWISDSACVVDSSAEKTSEVSNWKQHLRSNYSSLRAAVTVPLIYPAVVPELPADYLSRDQRQVAMDSAVIPLVRAMDLFSSEKYAECAAEMSRLTPVNYRLGGNQALRSTLNIAMIESFLRAGMYNETKTILQERVAISEYDAQSWFQLSSVAVHLGDEKLAQMAYMRAWQFGHRRAGSEGPLSGK